MINILDVFLILLCVCQEETEKNTEKEGEVGVPQPEVASETENISDEESICEHESPAEELIDTGVEVCSEEKTDQRVCQEDTTDEDIEETVSEEIVVEERREETGENIHETEAPCDELETPEENVEEPTDESPVGTVAEGETVSEEEDAEEEAEGTEFFEGFGYIDEIFDFVAEFSNSTSDNALETSASVRDISGGIARPAIFEHPLNEGDARLEYSLKLPQVGEVERLVLTFSIGLRDGVRFDDEERKPNGVFFALELNGERVFEGASETCSWADQIIDLARFAGREIQVTFLTNCNGEGNSSYDWALWGEPRILHLSSVEEPVEDGEPVIFTRGIVLAQLEDRLVDSEYHFPEGKAVGEIAAVVKGDLAEKWHKSAYSLKVYSYQPEIELVSFGPTIGVLTTTNDFDMRCVARNTGKVALTEKHNASVTLSGIKVRRDRLEKRLGRIEPDAESEVTWRIWPFQRETKTSASVNLKFSLKQGLVQRQITTPLILEKNVPSFSEKPAAEVRIYEHENHVVMENAVSRATFVRGVNGFGYYILSTVRNGSYQQVATSCPIAEFAYRDEDGHIQSMTVCPKEYEMAGNNQGESTIMFTAQEEDADGVLWDFEAHFSMFDRIKRLSVEYQLSAQKERELIYFRGPMLRVGDGAFGSKKNFALFPGLEYLGSDEASSSERDAAPPINLRLVPHPYKITIPLMAVEYNKCLVALLWDAQEKWDGEHDTLSAIFASPNWHERQNNHLMGLFLPAVGDIPPSPPLEKGGRGDFAPLENGGKLWVNENQTQASTPYHLANGKRLTLKAQVVIDNGTNGKDPKLLDAITHWIDAYGMPEPLTPPRSDEEELLLIRHGFMHTAWDDETQKSRHCVGWAPANAPGFATLLWYDYLATHDQEVKERVHKIAEKTIADSGLGGLASNACCHIMRWELPFYYGGVEEAMNAVKGSIQEIISKQGEDGSWRFQPSEKTRELGKEADAVLGTCAQPALAVLKYARITGDDEALQAGEKALKFMDKFKVPRGAQAWECPLYEPDILAAAYAVGAYVEAYHTTGKGEYLAKAEYWAKTGLPFLYFWNHPERPGMRFASIPVFGTTFYTHSWFGVPVQWNGLVYAYYLQHLAEYNEQLPWKKIAEGITISAMYQQWTEGELKGTYPDGFYGYCTEGRGPHINPEDIVVNLYALRGLDPDIATVIVKRNGARIHISSGAQIDEGKIGADGTLNFNLRYVPQETSYTLISGFDGNAGSGDSGFAEICVTADDGEISQVENRQETPVGFNLRDGFIYLKLFHAAADVKVKVSPRKPEEEPVVESDAVPDEEPSEPEETQPSNTETNE